MRALGACIGAEMTKLRRSPIWIPFLVLPLCSCVIGSANYSLNLGVLTPGWSNLWTQQTIFLCYFFLPAMLGAGCSFMWRLEHTGTNWNGLMCAPVPAWCVLTGKIVVAAGLSAISFAGTFACFLVSGCLLGVPGDIPFATIGLHIVLGWAGSLAIVAIQSFISMIIRSFALPVGLGLAGGVMGLMATMAGAGYVFSYALMQNGMGANTLADFSPAHVGQIVVLSVLYVVVVLFFATRRLTHHDIATS